jgi:hypothetical protein
MSITQETIQQVLANQREARRKASTIAAAAAIAAASKGK